MIAQAIPTQPVHDDPVEGPDRGSLVDSHCHCLPGVDDGPESMDQAIALCEALVDDGVEQVIATPHQLGRYDQANDGLLIRLAVASLNHALEERGVPLLVHPGGEVRIDERLEFLLASDTAMTLGDSRTHVLLELPHQVAIDPLPLIESLAQQNMTVVIAHPERTGQVIDTPGLAQRWHAAGGQLQITAGSLLGDFGGVIRRVAWNLIQNQAVTLVASDAHDANRRPPRLRRAFDRLEASCGRDVARRLCATNAKQLLGSAVSIQR